MLLTAYMLLPLNQNVHKFTYRYYSPREAVFTLETQNSLVQLQYIILTSYKQTCSEPDKIIRCINQIPRMVNKHQKIQRCQHSAYLNFYLA
jgi:hypothetical protein